MKRFDRLEIRLTLNIAYAMGAFVVLLSALAFAGGYYQQLEETQNRIDQLASTVYSSASVAAFARNEEIAKDVVTGLTGNSIVVAARIESKDGFSYAQSRQPYFDWKDARTQSYPLTSPMSRGEAIGSLVIAEDGSYIHAHALRRAVGYSVVLLVETLAAVLIMVFQFRRWVSRPVIQLANTLHQINPSGGQRVAIPENHEDDEIGLVAASANRLLDATARALDEERALRAKVESMEAHYRHIFQTSSIGILVLDPAGRLINSNPALLDKVVGMPRDAAAAIPDFIAAAFNHPEDAWSLIDQAESSGHSSTADLQLKTSDGSERWVHAIFSWSPSRTDQGSDCIEGVLYEITARRLKENEVRRSAERDALTGVYNRRGCDHFLDRMLHLAGEEKFLFAVMLIDLDGFKQVNDRLGHAAGDEVLRAVAQRLRSRLGRARDMVGRLGGDEFLVAVYDCGEELPPLATLAHDLITLLSQPVTLADGTRTQVGASIGIARFPLDGSSRAALMAAADQAMYSVKQRGKNNFSFAYRPTNLIASV